MEKHDIIIIGGGPAGITAAIQLKRYNIDTLLLEKEDLGGLLRNAHLIENYLGFPDGISGRKLVELIYKQIQRIGVSIKFERVEYIEYQDNLFYTHANNIMISPILVIATGTIPRKLSEDIVSPKLIGKQVFYEITSIENVFRKNILIIGGGDAAFDYALTLSENNKVIIINRREKPKCLPVLWEYYLNNPSISYYPNVEVEEIRKVENGLIVVSTSGRIFNVDYVVAAIGREPNIGFLSPKLMENIDKLIEQHRLYMIGDVRNNRFRQISISVGDGMRAAMDIIFRRYTI